ncbi:MAG: S1C family serine protease [Microthrixaceae bacterium]
MGPDDDDADDPASRSPLLPPDDRLWRHPSELAHHASPPRDRSSGSRAGHPPRGATWATAAAAGLAGAALSAGAIAATGSLWPRVVERHIVEKVAVTPVVSSPMIGSERGVDAVAQRVSAAIVRLDVERPSGAVTGSGVLYRDDGLILTSARSVSGATAIGVLLQDGRRLEGRLVGLDLVTDVALLDVVGASFPVAVLGTAEGLKVGQPTISIGWPLESATPASVTTGVISALGRRLDVTDGVPLHGMIQTDAPIAPGASGGALVDGSGTVIGITTAASAGEGGGFCFATPIDVARRVAEQLLATGRMVHGWLGVEGAELTVAQVTEVGSSGARVERVAAGSPAARAGLRAGDVITGLDAQRIGSVAALVVQLRAHEPGDVVVIRYRRAGASAQVTITLAQLP